MEFYANNIYTITISSVGIGGVTPDYVKPGACILAATLGDSRTLDDNTTNLVHIFHFLPRYNVKLLLRSFEQRQLNKCMSIKALEV